MSEEKKVVLNIVDDQKESDSHGFDISAIVENNASGLPGLGDDAQTEEQPKRRGRPPGSKNKPKEVVETPLNSNMTYAETYAPIMGQLAQTVGQIDEMEAQIQEDLRRVRKFKDTTRNKFEYITELTGSATGLIGNRISALREMSSINSKCHDLELRKAKELSATQTMDDDKAIMDMYRAYINTPIGSIGGMPYGGAAPMSQGTLMAAGVTGNSGMDGYDSGFNTYMKNLTPEQNMMLMENNPNVQQVVIYDANTQQKAFAVIDTNTGQQIPNTPTLPDEILNDVTVDVTRGTARAAAFNMNFPLKIIGEPSYNEY